MRIDKLTKNIMDQIKEGQLKLGYVKESVRLYYPLASLNAILQTEYLTAEKLVEKLKPAMQEKGEIFGGIEFRCRGERIEISVSQEAVEYIHENVKDPDFLVDIIKLFQHNHHCTLEEICRVFEHYSNDYICKKMPDDSDFDYVLYFADSSIDDYYYCIKMEMGHTIYHRFTEGDYKDLVE